MDSLHLDNLKTSTTGTVIKRRKKINILPGKSVSPVDLIISSLISTPTTSQYEKSKTLRKTIEQEEVEEDDASNFSDSINSSDAEGEIDWKSNPSTSSHHESDAATFEETDRLLLENGNLEVADYIICKFPTKKRERLFVAKIESIDINEITISGLRKRGLAEGYFVFPEIPDISLIESTQVLKKVVIKSVQRGKHYFLNITHSFKLATFM